MKNCNLSDETSSDCDWNSDVWLEKRSFRPAFILLYRSVFCESLSEPSMKFELEIFRWSEQNS